MACANVANLMLARGAARAREMAVRASLGAGGARLVRQLLTESLLLAALGGAGGLGLAWVLIRMAPRFIPDGGLPAGLALSLDLRVVAFTILVSLGTGILFGLAPAWQLAKGSLADAMRGGGRGIAAGNSRLLGTLAMVEIAIAVIVVSGAGLFLRTLERLSQVDPGYHAERVLTMRVMRCPSTAIPNRPMRSPSIRRRSPKSRACPACAPPPSAAACRSPASISARECRFVGPQTEASRSGSAHYQIVGARYFETLGIPLQAGRAFTAHDDGQVAAGRHRQPGIRTSVPRRPTGGRRHIRVQRWIPPVPGMSIGKLSASADR